LKVEITIKLNTIQRKKARGEFEQAVGRGEIVMKFLSGTGKWKGIKGEGRIKVITRGKPIIPGTSQVCYRHTRTFELPK